LSSPACEWAWRFTAKRFCGEGFAAAANVTPSFFSVPTVIGVSAIAASVAGTKLGSISGGTPTADINRARKGDSITATDSESIVNAARKRA